MDPICDVTITGPDADTTARLVRSLVDDRLAACGNIIPHVRSIYRWHGNIEDQSEAAAVLHTRQSLVPQIIEQVNAQHPDDTPQILAVPIVAADPGYQQWVLDETT